MRDPDVLAELSGDTENWKVKVANSVNEVMASYTVDEYEMEIAIRLPVDYPLHGIEVRDVKRLGAEENRWRGWLLAVQQVITSQVRASAIISSSSLSINEYFRTDVSWTA